MSDAEILIGTYEDYVVGYRVEIIDGGKPKKKLKTTSTTNKKDSTTTKQTNGHHNGGGGGGGGERFSLEQSFALRGHSGSVRCLVANESGTLALSGGFDEMINLVSLRKRKLLQTSEGAFNCCLFVGNKHLLCGSEDSNIYIYECKNSQMKLVKTLKGHKEAVVSMHAHPSGKVLLSLSKDNTMKTWNLIKGRCAYTTNIGTPAHLISWTRSGDGFLLTANNEIHVYANESGLLEHTFKLEKRINSIEFISDNVFVVASDWGKLEFYNLKEGKLLKKLDAHETRIKCVRLLSSPVDPTTTDGRDIRFVTASSDGVIKLWRLEDDSDLDNIEELTKAETGTRLTCMTTAVRALKTASS